MIAANTQTEGDMILVTGASGTVGTALVAVLKAGGHRFRAAYHAADKAAAAAQDGYDAVTIDLTKPDTLPPALVGVDAVFLLGTGVRRQAEGEKNMLDAAGAAGIRLLVKQSIWRAAEEEYALAHMHRSVEEAIEASGLAWTFLRPNGFMQNLSGPMAAAIKATGAIYQPAADARISFIDARDIAAAAAVVLTTTGHDGMAYDLSGPEALSYRDVARELSRVLGKAIAYVPLSDDAARSRMSETGMPGFYIDAMLDLYRAYRGGIAEYVSPDFQKLTGRAPTPLERFADDHAECFR